MNTEHDVRESDYGIHGTVRIPTGKGEIVDDSEDVVHSFDAPTGLKI